MALTKADIEFADRLRKVLGDVARERLDEAERATGKTKLYAVRRAVAALHNYGAYIGLHECDEECRWLEPFGHRSLDTITVQELLLDSTHPDDLSRA